METCCLELPFQYFELVCSRGAVVEAGVDGLGQGLAKLFGYTEDLRGFAIGHGAEEMLRLGWGQEIRLLREVDQIAVGLEEFFGAALSEAPIQGVDEVERGMSGDELKASG